MTRRLGAVDRRPRRGRSDRGKRRKKYAGKPVKGKRQIKYERRIGNKSQIKVWIWERLPMSYDGRKRWHQNVRHNIYPEITKTRSVHIVETSEFDTKQKVEQFMEVNYWAGTFIIMGFSHAKNKRRCKPVPICRIVIKETNDGLRARMVRNIRLHRYWFWRK
jgi:hypothetical protein